jgi:hypothetical protein
MEKTWDNSLSILVNSNPQAFLDLFLPGAMLRQQHHTKLKGTQRQPDVVLEVERFDDIFIYNPEFQSYRDNNMAERSLLYHILLGCEFRTPKDQPLAMRSCVVTLFKQAKMKPAPLRWFQPGELFGRRANRVRFDYDVVEMWKQDHRRILDLGHRELYPLLPLTNGGATRQIVTFMLDELSEERYRDFALIGFTCASRIFRDEKRFDDLAWIQRRYHTMYDIIHDSPLYDWIYADGHEGGVAEGLARGQAQGLAQGQAQGLAQGQAQSLAQMRQTIVDIMQEYFPELAELAAEIVATVDNPGQLVHLSVKLGRAQNAEEARHLLLQWAQ